MVEWSTMWTPTEPRQRPERSGSTPRPATGPYVSVIGKAVAVLDSLYEARTELSLAELSRRLRISRTTVYRLLATLEHHGLVARTDLGYTLGLRLFTLGSAVHERIALARLAAPHLEAIAETFRVSSYLSVRDGDVALCIERIDRGGVHLAAYRTGETLPLHIGAGPIVLLAALPNPEIERILAQPLLRATAGTISSPDALRARVAEVRESGLAWADSDLEVGVLAVAAPIQDPSGRTIAAVSVAGLAQQITPDRRAALADAVRRAAREIGNELAEPTGMRP